MTLKDKLVLILLSVIRKMGYTFYIRNTIDSPRFNGDDIAIFKCNNTYCTFKIVAFASGMHRKSLDTNEFTYLGKI